MKTLEDSNLHCYPKSRGASVPTGNGASSFPACHIAEDSCPSERRTWKQHPSGRKPPVGLPSEPRVCEKRTLSLHWMTWGSKALSLVVGAEARAQLPTSACCSDPCANPPGCITHHSDNWIVCNSTSQTAWEEWPVFFKCSNEPQTNTFVIYN